MIDMYTKQQLILSYHRDGKSIRSISRELGIHRSTVTSYVREFEASLQALDVSEKDESSMEVLIEALCKAPTYDSSNRKKRKLSDEIQRCLDEYISANAKKRSSGRSKQCMKKRDMWEDLQNRGYQIGYTTVCNYVRKAEQKLKEVYIRQEMLPGFITEFDWGHIRLTLGGKQTRVLMAVFTLKYSAYRYARLYYREDGISFTDAHVHYFDHIGYVSREVVYDNARVMVARHVGKQKEPTERLMELSLYYGYKHRFTNAYSGHEKGSVERSVEYVRRKSFCMKDEFDNLDQANEHLLNKLHQINGRIPKGRSKNAYALLEEEYESMMKAPAAYQSSEYRSVRVDKYSCVSIDTNQYSVPEQYVGQMLNVRLFAQRIEIYDDHQLIARHTRHYAKYQYFIDINHYLQSLQRKPGALATSTALSQAADSIKDLYKTYYQDKARSFVMLLVRMREKAWSIDQIYQAHQICSQKCGIERISLDKITVLMNMDPQKPKEAVQKEQRVAKTGAMKKQHEQILLASRNQLKAVSSLLNNPI